jgi:hypothetical protein
MPKRIWAVEHKVKMIGGYCVKELLLEGHPYHLCESNAKIWKECHDSSHKFKVVSIIRKWED